MVRLVVPGPKHVILNTCRGAAPSSSSASGWRSATSFHIASSHEQAIREAAPHYEENMKMFGELRLVRALTDEQIAEMRDPRLADTVKLPTIEDAVKAGGFLAGRPEDIIEALKAVEKRYPGLDRVICATPLGTPLDVQLEDLDRFANEVIPAFRDTRTAAAAQ